MKDRIRENGIDYVLVGDYYIPDLDLPEEERRIGKYGCMHREYLKLPKTAKIYCIMQKYAGFIAGNVIY